MGVCDGTDAVECGSGAMVSFAARPEVAELGVDCFVEWPLPFQVAKVQGQYEAALGIPVNWSALTPAWR